LRFTPLAEAIDERRTADSSAFLLCLHEAVALQHGHVLSYARRRQPQEPREFLNRPFSMTMQVIEDLSTGRLHCVNSTVMKTGSHHDGKFGRHSLLRW